MTEADAYLRDVAAAMRGIDRRIREDVIRELKAHLADAAADGGESSVVADLESPQAIARRYTDLYGYGKPFQVLFVLIAAGLAVVTVPLFGLPEPVASAISLLVLAVLVVYLLLAAMRGGSSVGLLASLAACVARIVTLVAAQLVAEVSPVTDARGWILFLAVSALLVVLGYVPGRAKEKWTKRDVSM
jgi:uncharacterized membrane protein